MDLFYQSRAYPVDEIPVEKLAKAFETQRMEASTRGSRFSGSWHALGPLNFGGRTLQITFNPLDPRTVYACSASGGLWVSRSGGVGPTAWQRVNTGYPVSSTTCLAISAADTGLMFLGTGEVYNYGLAGTGYAVWPTRGFYGIGILKTRDGGKTWTKSLDWSSGPLRGVWMIKFNPQNAATLWAGTTEGLYRSTDTGNTWQLALNVKMVTDFLIHPQDTLIMLAACGDLGSPGHGLYRSADGGNTWQKLGTAEGIPDFYGKIMLGICKGSPDNMYASIGYPDNARELYRSTDKGAHWQPMTTDRYAYGWFAHDLSVHPANPLDVICAGVSVYKLQVPGDSLSEKSRWWAWDMSATPIGGPEGPPDYVHADIHDIVRHPDTPEIVYFATDGGIFRSLDNGETFSGHNGGYQTQQFYQGLATSWSDSMFALAGMQDNSTAVYEGHYSFRRVVGGDGAYCIIRQWNDNVVYASTQWGRHYKSTNHAQNFSYLSGLDYHIYNTNFVSPLVAVPGQPDVLFAGKDSVYKSTNGGLSWANLGQIDNGRPVLALAISRSNANVLYAATSPMYLSPGITVTLDPPAGLFRSDDGGQTWSSIRNGLPDRFYNDIAIDPSDSQTAFVALGGYGSHHIYNTRDGGNTWSVSDSGLPDLPVNALLIDPSRPKYMYAGTDLGVYVSADSGATWSLYSDGLPEAVIVYDLAVTANHRLIAATHGNGLYMGDMMGAPLGTGLSIPANALMLYPNPVSDYLKVAYNLPDANGTWAVYSLDGRVLMSGRLQNHSGVLELDMEHVISGQYLFAFRTGGRSLTRRFAVLH